MTAKEAGPELSGATAASFSGDFANRKGAGGLPTIRVAPEGCDWAAFATSHIFAAVETTVSSRGMCDVVLTGGATAERLYSHWKTADQPPWGSMRFYFGDERCVPPDHGGSNYAMAMRCLLGAASPGKLMVARMEGENADIDGAARLYESKLPAYPDILLLGLGLDGHIASLFPHDPVLAEKRRRVVPVRFDGVKFQQRLSITPLVIAAARSIFLLATGAEKGRVLAQALQAPMDFSALPVRLAIRATWLLDREASIVLNEGSSG